MELRQAQYTDLPKLKIMYKNIVKRMEKNGVYIWDENYPYQEFPIDIDNKSLYIICDDEKIVSAFGLCERVAGSENFSWENPNAKSIYLVRLGINADCQNQGIGAKTIEQVKHIAKGKGCEYLRLQVVDSNIPAINFYKKQNFVQAEGCYVEVIDEDFQLTEYGFEIKL